MLSAPAASRRLQHSVSLPRTDLCWDAPLAEPPSKSQDPMEVLPCGAGLALASRTPHAPLVAQATPTAKPRPPKPSQRFAPSEVVDQVRSMRLPATLRLGPDPAPSTLGGTQLCCGTRKFCCKRSSARHGHRRRPARGQRRLGGPHLLCPHAPRRSPASAPVCREYVRQHSWVGRSPRRAGAGGRALMPGYGMRWLQVL